MDFWDHFLKESLQSPWIIRSQSDAEPYRLKIQPPKIFVVSPVEAKEGQIMIQKMIAALKWNESNVLVLDCDEEKDGWSLESLEDTKDILFFGESFPGEMGRAKNWQGHQIMKTHSIETLVHRPELKMETWAHLKEFARL